MHSLTVLKPTTQKIKDQIISQTTLTLTSLLLLKTSLITLLLPHSLLLTPTRHFPRNWKTAIVFPIHKPGKNKKSPDSYRPISLLSSLSKIAEHIILLRINQFINNTNFLNPNQYGFTKQLSTYHPLLRLTEQISAGFQRQIHWSCFLDIERLSTGSGSVDSFTN
ncbi:putative RNA-directed DNA polymerase from transposon X-element [Trichonephila clavipes]|nr:putative RNA-directed DNA polymerase from transposon X-element [Trichonephila clavipes]